MNPALQSWLQLAVLVVVIVATMLHIDKRFDALDRSINKRIDDLRSELTGLIRSEISGLREVLRSEVKRLEDRIQRIGERLGASRRESPVML